MEKYEAISSMPAEEKKKLFEALKKAATLEEAKQAFETAGLTLTEEDIKQYQKEKGAELSDEELSGIAGGAFYPEQWKASPDMVRFVAEVGQVVEVGTGWFGTTVRCTITDRRVSRFLSGGNNYSMDSFDYYYDEYYVVPFEEHFYFSGGWVRGSRLEIP